MRYTHNDNHRAQSILGGAITPSRRPTRFERLRLSDLIFAYIYHERVPRKHVERNRRLLTELTPTTEPH